MSRTKIYFGQPMYIGVCILEISKILMYDFFYKLKEIYGDKIKLLYCDTDFLIIEVFTDEDMKERISEYDTSDYDKHNIYEIPQVNYKLIGKFKDELNGKIIECFI